MISKSPIIVVLLFAASLSYSLAAAGLFVPGPATAQESDRWGPARDNLDRFIGVYGVPDGKRRRDIYVAMAEPNADLDLTEGYLLIGDIGQFVSPSVLRSVGETRFLRRGYNKPDTTIEFEMDPDGTAIALTFLEGTLFGIEEERLERLRDLPASWEGRRRP